MSSEESDDDNDSIVVKPMLWQSPKATEVLQNLDLLGIEGKTMQARSQRKEKVLSSEASSRPKPVLLQIGHLCLNLQYCTQVQ